jgi:hypothetical protein
LFTKIILTSLDPAEVLRGSLQKKYHFSQAKFLIEVLRMPPLLISSD